MAVSLYVPSLLSNQLNIMHLGAYASDSPSNSTTIFGKLLTHAPTYSPQTNEQREIELEPGNITEALLQEPHGVSAVWHKEYYGRIRTESSPRTTKQMIPETVMKNKFDIYEILRKLKPKTDQERFVSQRKLVNVASAKGTRSIDNFRGDVHSATPSVINSIIFSSLNNSLVESPNKMKVKNTAVNEDLSKKMHHSGVDNYSTAEAIMVDDISPINKMAAQKTDTRWQRITDLLKELAKNPKVSSEIASEGSGYNQSEVLNSGSGNQHHHTSVWANWTSDLSTILARRRRPHTRTIFLVVSYTTLMLVSLFANLLVCHVVLRTRRLHTLTNTFLANLAVSDLVMTTMNIPFSVARVLLDDWPFGSVMCCLVPFVQVASVYVSSFTMAAIAIDRYQVIMRPLHTRMGAAHGAVIIGVIWTAGAMLALPYAVYNEVVEVYTFTRLLRCRSLYPPPPILFRRRLTLATFLAQYALPLLLTMVAYAAVIRRVWCGAAVGVSTLQQATLRIRAKKKTVKMLVVVVVLFALCWLPLNTYHLVVDFSAPEGPSRHSSTAFFLCHWLAMSSVCYNPFIYCWLNDNFRAGAKAWLRCVGKKVSRLGNCGFLFGFRRGIGENGDDENVERATSGIREYVVGPSKLTTSNYGKDAAVSSSSSSAINCVPFSVGKKLADTNFSKFACNGSKTCGFKSSFLTSSCSVKSNNNKDLKNLEANQIHIPLEELIPKNASVGNVVAGRKKAHLFTKRVKNKVLHTPFSSASSCSISSVRKFGNLSSSESHYSSNSQTPFAQTANRDLCSNSPFVRKKKHSVYFNTCTLREKIPLKNRQVYHTEETTDLNKEMHYKSFYVQSKTRSVLTSEESGTLNSSVNSKKFSSFSNEDHIIGRNHNTDHWTLSNNRFVPKDYQNYTPISEALKSKETSEAKSRTLHFSLMYLGRHVIGSSSPSKSGPTLQYCAMQPTLSSISRRTSSFSTLRLQIKSSKSNLQPSANSCRCMKLKNDVHLHHKNCRNFVAVERAIPSCNKVAFSEYINYDNSERDEEPCSYLPSYLNSNNFHVNGFRCNHHRRHSAPTGRPPWAENGGKKSLYEKQNCGIYDVNFCSKNRKICTATRRSHAFKLKRWHSTEKDLRFLSLSAPLLDIR